MDIIADKSLLGYIVFFIICIYILFFILLYFDKEKNTFLYFYLLEHIITLIKKNYIF